MINQNFYQQALKVAQTYDVSTPKNSAVLYSISYQPTKANKIKAFDHISQNKGLLTLDHTECGAKLIEMGLEFNPSNLSKDQIIDIWTTASKRFIKAASGNITAFVENADERSVFKSIELPMIMENPKIKTINNINKFDFK